MERADKNLAFMLQYENIAWYENGKVRILDRRIYPTKVEFVECTTHQEVTKAIDSPVIIILILPLVLLRLPQILEQCTEQLRLRPKKII